MSGAHITIVGGRIGSDAEVRQAGESSVTHFRMACSTKIGGEDHTDWYTVNVWGRYGDALRDHLKKGEAVSVSGRFRSRAWQSKEGVDRTSLEIDADSVHVAFREDARGNTGGRPPAGRQQHQEPPDDDIPF